MAALPNIIPKSIIEVLNRLENDEDNRYSWKLTRNQDSLSLTVSCKLPAKTPNKAKDNSEVAERATVKQVRRRRKKRNSPSALARSRRRHTRFLEKKAAGKPDSPSPEDQQDPVCVKELEIPVLFVVVTVTWSLWISQHQPQLLSLTCYMNGQSFLIFWPRQTLIVTIVRTTR